MSRTSTTTFETSRTASADIIDDLPDIVVDLAKTVADLPDLDDDLYSKPDDLPDNLVRLPRQTARPAGVAWNITDVPNPSAPGLRVSGHIT